MKRSCAGEVRNVSLLVASAVNSEGLREILGLCEGCQGRQSGWSAFFYTASRACSWSFPTPAEALSRASRISCRRRGHKGKAIRRLIRAAGAKLIFLPKYLPDLNPSEQLFAKLKHLLRKIATRTVDDVCASLGQILAAFTPDECANYFRNSGYAQT